MYGMDGGLYFSPGGHTPTIRNEETMNRPFTTVHEQVRIRHAGLEADVDKKLAPLILALWREGIKTVCSCQDHPDFGLWVVMLAEHEAAFRKLLRGYKRQFDTETATIIQSDFDTGGWKWPGAHAGE